MIKKLKIGIYKRKGHETPINIVKIMKGSCKYSLSNNSVSPSSTSLTSMISHLNHYGFSLSHEEKEEDYEVH